MPPRTMQQSGDKGGTITVDSLNDALREAAAEEGFSMLGIAPAVQATGVHDLSRWIDIGYAGEMDYLSNRKDAYRHPSSILDGVRSLVALAYPYASTPFRPHIKGQGKLARYLWSGDDYHDLIHPKLKRLGRIVSEIQPDSTWRGVVDTAPLLEREVAQRAGLGWCGKNTLLLNRDQGSYFFLACLLTNIQLSYDTAHYASHCGTCTACLDACPTQAFPQPGVLDANRCISYLTIEHRGPIPLGLREPIGQWLFGCDICQEVCPWNQKNHRSQSPSEEQWDCLELEELFTLDEATFRARFRKTPLWRARRRGILRNAAIVLGNQKNVDAVESLATGLCDSESLVRGASAWALGRIGTPDARKRLMDRRLVEVDPLVIEEIAAALENSGSG